LFDEIDRSGALRVVDMCSGAGGPWLSWKHSQQIEYDVTLTDKYPNETLVHRLSTTPLSGLHYLQESIDATNVPPRLPGFRTIFTAFHHFPPLQAQRIIRDAIAKRQPIGIFEFTIRKPSAMALMLLSPFGVWLTTATVGPRSWSKLLFTYVLPLIPLIVTFDGVVSCWRTYTPDELISMAGESDYKWKSGTIRGPNGPVTYLIGYVAR
jgi:hypothetical protein